MQYIYDGRWDEAFNDPRVKTARERLSSVFGRLIFEPEGHTYTLDGRPLHSVSRVIGMRFEPVFDVEEESRKCYLRNRNNVWSPYFGKTAGQIAAMWEEKKNLAAEKGHLKHAFAETVFRMVASCRRIPVVTTDPYEEAILRFYMWLPAYMVPVAAEVPIFNEDAGYAGTFDLLCLDMRTGRFFLFDWKTNADLMKNFAGQRLLPPFDDLLDMPLNLYTLQQSCYQLALGKAGLSVSHRYLIHIKDDGTFKLHQVDDITGRLAGYFQEHPLPPAGNE